MLKKFLFTILAVALIFVGGQNNFAQATDVYVGNESNGDTVYLMTDSIKKTKRSYNQDWKMWYYDCYFGFKSVDSRNRSFFFGYTIVLGPEEEPGYRDRNGKWQGLSETGEVVPGLNSDPDVYRAKILNRAYKYLCDNGYI